MLSFLRRIRKSLIESGSLTRYWLYAIGEIALVVIGILIALQVNNWNQKRIDREKEGIYLRNIERDLNDQLETIDLQINYETSITSITTPIVEYYKAHQSFQIDSVFTVNMGYISGRKTFVKNAPTYTQLLSSGNIDIISDEILKDHIIVYYQELERLELIFNKNNNLFVDQVFVPSIIELSEMQISGEFSNPGTVNPQPDMVLIDLNEDRLKDITKDIISDAQNELKLINIVNFRNFISIIHLGYLMELKESTETLLKQVEGFNLW